MAVRIRLKKMGRKKRPFYRLVAIDSRKRRDGLEIERLGWYDPLKNENSLDIQSMTCSKNECIGQYSSELKPFMVSIKKLNNHIIQLIRKNSIEYSFSSSLDLGRVINHNYAVIIDIDETVLDNSNYQVMLNETGDSFSQESWSKWVQEEDANLVPGSKDFLDKVRDDGIRVIYISNRMHSNLQPTIGNFKKLGIYSEDDIYLLRKDRADKKPIRRGEVFSGIERMDDYPIFNVIAFLGDAYGDFPEGSKYEWGKHNFIFPNPMYGKW